MIKIITDSSADLPKDIIDQYDIRIVPLTVTISGRDYKEIEDISPEEFFEKMFSTTELPKTSQPSPAAFADAYLKMDHETDILCLTISSGLSGTYQSALLGKDLVDRNVTVFDTLAGSLSHGLQVIRAAKLVKEGFSINEIVTDLSSYRENMNILVLLNTLENVVKGGRLSKFQGTLAKVLNIKVVLERVEGGKIEILEKIRGSKRFQKRVFDIIQERGSNFSNMVFGITHTGNLDEVEVMKKEIERIFQPKEIIVNYMGATMGTYAGKNGMIVAFNND